MAQVDLERQLVDGRIHRALLGGLAMMKLQTSLSSESSNDQLQCEIDLGAQTWTADFKYGISEYGQILSRFFHLLHSRRGQEQNEDE